MKRITLSIVILGGLLNDLWEFLMFNIEATLF